jgi:hypothetical protein
VDDDVRADHPFRQSGKVPVSLLAPARAKPGIESCSPHGMLLTTFSTRCWATTDSHLSCPSFRGCVSLTSFELCACVLSPSSQSSLSVRGFAKGRALIGSACVTASNADDLLWRRQATAATSGCCAPRRACSSAALPTRFGVCGERVGDAPGEGPRACGGQPSRSS